MRVKDRLNLWRWKIWRSYHFIKLHHRYRKARKEGKIVITKQVAVLPLPTPEQIVFVLSLAGSIRRGIKWLFVEPEYTYICSKCNKHTGLHEPICEHCHTDNPYWRKV